MLNLASLSEAEQQEYMRLREARDGQESLDSYIRRVSPQLPPPAHYAPIIADLERARRERVRLLWSMPPRHGKTMLLKHAIGWWLSHTPADTCGYMTYSDRKAWSESRKAKKIAIAGGVTVERGASNAEWRTPEGGGLLAVGQGSGLTGFGIQGLMVVDDPFKSMRDANSLAKRNQVQELFDSVVDTRDEGMSVIVIHTRWNEDDLIGRLAKRAEYKYLNIPALAEADDPFGREVDEPLWPERGASFVFEALDRRRRNNPFVFSAVYQGRPRRRGARVFGPDAHYYDPADLERLLEGATIVIGADPAATEKETADYSAMVALALVGDDRESRKAYVLEVYRQQVQVPDFAEDLVSFQRRHSNAFAYIEAVGAFKAVPQLIKKLNKAARVRGVPARGDKLMRAQEVAAAWNAGRVLVPRRAPWLQEFLEELSLFTGTGDVHDDQVDALAYAWNSTGKTLEYETPPGTIAPRRW